MAGSQSRKTRPKKKDHPYDFRMHDPFAGRILTPKVLTRSQTAFSRIRNSLSDMQLFADPSKYSPPELPHLLVTMKGKWGTVPRTFLCRDTARDFWISDDLCDRLESYKNSPGPEEPPDNKRRRSAKKTTVKTRRKPTARTRSVQKSRLK